MRFGNLEFVPVAERFDLVAEPVRSAIESLALKDVLVSEIDPELADTVAFCGRYEIGLDVSANCVVLTAKRADREWFAACSIFATTKADINGVVRKTLDARKVSFAAMDKALESTKMEYGGITPIGLPNDWSLLVDSKVAEAEWVIIGSGIRRSKLLVPGKLFSELPNVQILKNLGIQRNPEA